MNGFDLAYCYIVGFTAGGIIYHIVRFLRTPQLRNKRKKP